MYVDLGGGDRISKCFGVVGAGYRGIMKPLSISGSEFSF